MTARYLYKEYFEFKPQFKLWFAANDKPQIHGVDHVIWRRVLLVPFTVTVPQEEQDRDLQSKLTEEVPGIRQWLFEGCISWLRDGLSAPVAVTVATNAWREEANTVKHFVDERCVQSQVARVKAGVLYLAFRDGCLAEGLEVIDQSQFGRRLGALEFVRDRNNRDGRLWRGLDLAEWLISLSGGDMVRHESCSSLSQGAVALDPRQ